MEKQDKLTMHTANIADANFSALAKMFPNAVTETVDENGEVIRAIDAEVLAQEINTNVVSGKEERYQFTWPDKKKSVLLANAPIAATLRPSREESVDFDKTENLYIEGDNLDVLKLLRETYLNRVKMIYIDPPYNTGNDFIYEDDFKEEAGEFLKRDSQYDEQGNRLTSNFDSNGRFHTDWLNMIYPRLRVARDLLTDDGVIFISIDENEVHNLRKLCDDVFGMDNFLTQIVVKLRHENRILKGDKDFHEVCEYCLVYRKTNEYKQTKRVEDNTSIDKYLYEIKLKSAPLEVIELDGKLVEVYTPEMYEEIKHESPSDNYLQRISIRGSLKEGNSSGRFFMKHLDNISGRYGYLYKVPNMGKDKYPHRFFMRPPTESHSNGIYFQGVPVDKSDVKLVPYPNYLDFVDIFNNVGYEGGVVFRNGKKPVKFIEHLMTLAGVKEDKESLVLDFFSGSATTAHAILNMNVSDNGSRKFIMVQIPETTENNTEACKFLDEINRPYKITEIGKERIRRAGQKVNEEAGLTAQNLDTGFRVLKLDSSNMKEVYYTPEEYSQMGFNLEGFMDNIKPDRSDEDLLFQVMLDLGIPLSAKIEQDGNIFNVNDNYLIACFDTVDTAMITEIAQKQPYYAIFRDSSFMNDSALVNVEQIFNTYSPSTIRRVL